MLVDQGTIKKKVSDVVVGDLIDLEGDKYADNCSDPMVAFEFAEVYEIEMDGATRIVLHTSMGSLGFPPDHMVEWLDIRIEGSTL